MPGWTTIVMSIWIIGGIQILSIGIVGEYIGKTYIEVKERPKYIIEHYTKDSTTSFSSSKDIDIR